MYKYLLILLNLVLINATNIQFSLAEANYYKQFKDAFDRVNRDYVQVPDSQKMTDAAINGMLMSLDPHSSYLTDEDLEDFENQIEGEFGGIGVEVTFENGAIKVISPIDDLPAYKAGIKAGDYIIGVNGDFIHTIGFNKAVREMRGNPGTKVKLLVVKDEENKPKEVELTREIVKIKPVKTSLENEGIAYVRISTFNKHTFDELKIAFKKLKNEAKTGIKGIILDIRNNPGGPLKQAAMVSEYFIDSGVIVTTKGRRGVDDSVWTSSKFVEKAPEVPMIVIINGGSASASEIVAGALQYHRRALIVGTKSFGKGSVQTYERISPRAGMKLTTAKYYTPSGRSIQAEGIEPDMIIEPAKVEYSDQKFEEKRFSEASLKNYLKNDDKKELATENIWNKDNKAIAGADKESQKNNKNTQEEKKRPSELYLKDYQFARAYDLIRGLILSKLK